MLQFKEIGIDSLLVYISKAFQGDEKLRTTYHIKFFNHINDSAIDSYNRILELEHTSELPINYYGIEDNGEKVGFIVVIMLANVLYSFGLNINHRNDINKAEFINFVEKITKGNTTVYLYEKNTRAIEFLKRNNFQEVNKLIDNNHSVIQLRSCQ